jgi:hypothetical protein
MFDPVNDVAVVQLGTWVRANDRTTLTSIPGVALEVPDDAKLISAGRESMRLYNDVRISNDVFVFGYPKSLTSDQIDFERPLLRKGIVAGKNDARRKIVLDCPVYFGNSGGLVVQMDVRDFHSGHFDYSAIGIVTQYVPFVEELKSRQHGYTNISIENSGYSIVTPCDAILALV